MKLTTGEMQALVERAKLTEKGRDCFQPEKMIAEATKQLLDDGVPKELVAIGAAVAIGRVREMRARAELMRNIIPIQQLPQGAVYFTTEPLTAAEGVKDGTSQKKKKA